MRGPKIPHFELMAGEYKFFNKQLDMENQSKADETAECRLVTIRVLLHMDEPGREAVGR